MEAVIFDLDGVICCTDQYHYYAWKKIAEQEKIYFDETINERLRGVSRKESLDIILEGAARGYSDEEKERLAEQKNEIYVQLLQGMSEKDLTTGIMMTLDGLRTRGKKLAIGSSSRNAKIILACLGLGDYFDAVSDGTNISKSKPDPEVFLKAADMLGVLPEKCLVVEDANAGVEAARRGGFICAGIGNAAENVNTTYPLKKITELLQVVK